ncbi:hypothetical protein KQ247_02700 [Ruegeria pomeroyi]|uniref:Type I restriction-modification system, S subunit n=2 Tax=Ruegeria pomeroyi TaxID=89184 RepID=Q5LPW5_RUEPO|nr:type I restriction-modification system subunit S [Ruegeria pomeroyi]AAV95976.1 type I restriction-modification system, S subunit [Ruegeria pomeroyi DSS-3]NVK97625.1 hypothetical protein [Ruegeria pomeroyi]NVL02754.1 hypothetical protein [Ruegeria pomeroyi]QWV09538.1 hypothetical protein KQ247_02700 [Ruegeria pomeroyi]
MREDPTIRIGDLADGIRGVSYRPEHLQEDFGRDRTVLLRSTNIQDGQLDFTSIQIVPSYLVKPAQSVGEGDLVVCMSNGSKALVGKAARYKGEYGAPLTVGAFCSVFHPKTESDSAFLRHVFQGEQFRRSIDIILSGSAINNLKNSDVEGISIRAHSPTERATIADILDAIDDAILETDTVIEKLLLVHQGLVHDLTTLGLSKSGEIRRADQLEEFHETDLGPLPHSWCVKSIGRMAKDLALGTAARGANDGQDQLRLLKMGNLGWDALDTSTCELIDVDRVVHWKDALLLDGDLLFNTRNTPELVGKTAAYDQDDQRTVCDNNILRIRFPSEEMDGRFAAAYMANGRGKSRLMTLATGTTSVAAIYWRDLRDFQLPVPPREEREEIVRRLQVSRDTIRREKESRVKLSNLREGLRDDLLTGRKPVVAIREAAE